MNQSDLIQQLRDYQARWPGESETVVRFTDFISTHADCLARACLTGHLTGSAWVLNRAGTHVLLTHHGKLNIWIQPGGHADGDANLLRVAQSEVEEETGLKNVVPVFGDIFDIDVHKIPERDDVPAHLHWDLRYAMQATGDETYVVSPESHDLAWVEISRLQERTRDKSMLRLAAKWARFKSR